MTPASPLDLVAVIPVYNEEANLASVTQEWLEALAALGLRHKILLIDDGSKDRTPEIAADLAARHPGRVAHVRKTNSGHGRSCRHGYDLAIAMDTAWILQVDSDGQCDPSFFPLLWAKTPENDCVFGRRRSRDDGLARTLLSKGCQWATRLATRARVVDPNVPYRLFRREVLARALLRVPPTFDIHNVALSVVVARTPELRVARVPIHFRDRQGGTNSINLRKVIRMGLNMLRDLRSVR